MSVRFLVLALLAQQPRYGYEIRRWLVDTHVEAWTAIKPFSIHHALRQLERDGMACLNRVEANGRRDRSVYEITEQGRTELLEIARKLWVRIPRAYPSDLYLLITFGDLLPTETVRELALKLAEATRVELAERDRGIAAKDPLPQLWRAMFDNGRTHLLANLALIEQVIDHAGDLRSAGSRPEQG